MGLNISGESRGLVSAIQSLAKWREKDIVDAMQSGAEESLQAAKAEMQIYPPETRANSGPPYPYWSRGVGMVHSDGRVDPQSENYGDSWNLSIKRVHGGVDGELGNSASYAPWIATRRTQSWFHRSRGWKTIEAVAEKLGLTVSNVAVSSPLAKRIRASISVIQEKLQR